MAKETAECESGKFTCSYSLLSNVGNIDLYCCMVLGCDQTVGGRAVIEEG